ncbi:sterol-binding protein [Egicoccus sp. AB-alg6-2]|uniref:sterol-binding protein n=1 Tax=Egicoccus sp. AB-alg6-2 TaxID=3242692 RepID=UPI00359EFB50
MATVEEVDAVLLQLLGRLGDVDEDLRALLPSKRTIEARCPDIDYVRHAEWRRGELFVMDEPPARRADIRISVRSDDLVAIAAGELPFSRAYATNRVRLDASMTDLLRLRAVL